MKFAKWIKEQREKAGYSQGEISRYMGWTSPQFVSNWERGLSTPPPKLLPKIAKLYGVQPRDIAEQLYKIKDEKTRRELGLL